MTLMPRDPAAWTQGAGPGPLERDLSFLTDQLPSLPERKADFRGSESCRDGGLLTPPAFVSSELFHTLPGCLVSWGGVCNVWGTAPPHADSTGHRRSRGRLPKAWPGSTRILGSQRR